MNHISAEDLTFYKEDGKIMSGGFNVSSILMKKGIDLNQKGGGGSKSSIFDNLVVPAGLLYQKEQMGGTENQMGGGQMGGGDKNPEPIYYDEPNGKKDMVLDEDIYEKLLKMIEVNEKSLKKKTQKAKSKKGEAKNTKKNREKSEK